MFVFFSDHSSGGLPAGVLSYELLGVVIVKYNFLHVNRVLFKSLFLNKMALYQKMSWLLQVMAIVLFSFMI